MTVMSQFKALSERDGRISYRLSDFTFPFSIYCKIHHSCQQRGFLCLSSNKAYDRQTGGRCPALTGKNTGKITAESQSCRSSSGQRERESCMYSIMYMHGTTCVCEKTRL